MSAPFVREERSVQRRLRALGQRLNRELKFRDQRLIFLQQPTRHGIVQWRLDRRAQRVTETTPHDTACAIAQSANGAGIHLAYSEHWVHVGKGNRLRFRSSWMRFVVASAGLGPSGIQLRLEWDARRQNREGGFDFPGHGAAHPHWQIDLHAPASYSTTSSETVVDLETSQPTETIDLAAQDIPTSEPSRWFHKLHLPARTMWHERACGMPNYVDMHQHQPSGCRHIDNWVISAIRYMRHEFSAYS